MRRQTQFKRLLIRIPALHAAYCLLACSNGKIAPAQTDEAPPQAIAAFSTDDHTPNNVDHAHNRCPATYNAPSPLIPLTRTWGKGAR